MLYCTVLYGNVLCCAVLYCTVLYCAVLYYTVLYCTVLYCTVLYGTVLCCTILYCTILCCTVLYCAVLFSSLLTITQSVKIFLALYGVRDLMTCSQEPGPILYPSQLNPVHILTSYLFHIRLTVIFSVTPSPSEFVSKYYTHFFLACITILNVREKPRLHCSFAFRLYNFAQSL